MSASRRRAWLRPVLMVAAPLAAILAAAGLWLSGGRYVSTENAYVKTHIAQVSAEVAGRIARVLVRDHATVEAGEVLVELDAEPFRLALARADAELDRARQQVAVMVAAWREATSELAEAETQVDYWKRQLERQRQLAGRGVIASTRLEETERDAAHADDRLATMRRKVERTRAEIGQPPEAPVDEHPAVRERLAARDQAALDLQRTRVAAPISGTAVNVRLQPGEHVRAAVALFAVVDDREPWLEANFKETELTHVRTGQRVEVVLDTYPQKVWTGEVLSISPATGAEFALLPPQNASGNWVKVVQRLPVRIRVSRQDGDPILRAGMTASVRVDTGRQRRIGKLIGSWSASATGAR